MSYDIYRDLSRPMIRVWPWWDAPDEFRALSPHCGDEDWLAFIPKEIAEKYGVPDWIGREFGPCDVSEHRQLTGDIICIGAHA